MSATRRRVDALLRTLGERALRRYKWQAAVRVGEHLATDVVAQRNVARPAATPTHQHAAT